MADDRDLEEARRRAAHGDRSEPLLPPRRAPNHHRQHHASLPGGLRPPRGGRGAAPTLVTGCPRSSTWPTALSPTTPGAPASNRTGHTSTCDTPDDRGSDRDTSSGALTSEPGSPRLHRDRRPGGVPHPRLPTPRLPTPLRKQQARTPGVRALPMARDITVVSEGGLEPPRPYRALGPQPSASANSATPTWPSGTPGRRDTLAQRLRAPNRPRSLVRRSAAAPAAQEDAEQPQDREAR